MSQHTCPYCGDPTEYQMYSGGKEWYCFGCDLTEEYADEEGPRRVQMLRTQAGRTELRTEMLEELERQRND